MDASHFGVRSLYDFRREVRWCRLFTDIAASSIGRGTSVSRRVSILFLKIVATKEGESSRFLSSFSATYCAKTQ